MYDAHFLAKPDFNRFPAYPIGVGHIFDEPNHLVNGMRYGQNFYNIHFVVRGSGWLRTGVGSVELKSGMGFVYAEDQYQHFGTYADDPWEVWWIYLSGEGIRDLIGDKRIGDVWAFSFEGNTRLIALMEELWDAASKNDMAYVPRYAALTYEILLEILLHSADLNAPSEPGLVHAIRRAAEFMRMNCAKDLPLQKLADQCGISPAYFSRTFHTQMGMPPLTYLNMLRIELSKQMLITTSKPVKQIALEAGFSKPSYYIERFRLAEGVTPSVFRDRYMRPEALP
ncbi:AraC family transcriptional regulator [Paenibacillus sp. CF384]|uniref:helix-turn-helix transcriptional regulator n=1 Tax=Paenibacillus sp. CF384 TaxID=1884382 RepID=UPI0008962C73|nr:AraC family transcriptional regulator [Paenibacillus sp. CF384]SDX34013.1 transcriptional regulator, AraC family [Paenibacillus sp. CF384]